MTVTTPPPLSPLCTILPTFPEPSVPLDRVPLCYWLRFSLMLTAAYALQCTWRCGFHLGLECRLLF